MKNLLTNFSKIRGYFSASQGNDVGYDCRLTVVRPSFDRRSSMLKLCSILVILLTVGVGQMWATTTYKLTAVTSVSAGNKYVFVRSSRALINTVSSKALQTTDTYNTTSLAGNEAYVWTLETATNGFYIKSCKDSKYLKKGSDNTEIALADDSGGDWTINFTDGVALISNTSASNRFLGETSSGSNVYKGYATSNLGSYGHDFTVYRLDEEAVSCSNYSFVFLEHKPNRTFVLVLSYLYRIPHHLIYTMYISREVNFLVIYIMSKITCLFRGLVP